jgi:hypothetical protein
LTKHILATCPSCRRKGRFEWLGEQRWPEAVARKLGVPTIIALWSCPYCSTTVSEIALLDPTNETEEASEDASFISDDSTPLQSSYLTC